MAVSTNISDELKKSLMGAENVDEVKAIFEKAGQAISEEDAEHIFEELSRKKTEGELSEDELETVTGGGRRDWLTDGCASTVEPGSSCWSNDACRLFDETYFHKPYQYCSVCGQGILYFYDWDEMDNNYYVCNNCGAKIVVHDDSPI